jgi:hypothetical protein
MINEINLTNEQIIAKFKMYDILIKISDCTKKDKGMIVTIHNDYGILLFSTYYSAYAYYKRKNIIN